MVFSVVAAATTTTKIMQSPLTLISTQVSLEMVLACKGKLTNGAFKGTFTGMDFTVDFQVGSLEKRFAA